MVVNTVHSYDLHVINCSAASRPFYTWLDNWAFKMILGRAKSWESLNFLLLYLKYYKQHLCSVHLRNVGRSASPATDCWAVLQYKWQDLISRTYFNLFLSRVANVPSACMKPWVLPDFGSEPFLRSAWASKARGHPHKGDSCGQCEHCTGLCAALMKKQQTVHQHYSWVLWSYFKKTYIPNTVKVTLRWSQWKEAPIRASEVSRGDDRYKLWCPGATTSCWWRSCWRDFHSSRLQ